VDPIASTGFNYKTVIKGICIGQNSSRVSRGDELVQGGVVQRGGEIELFGVAIKNGFVLFCDSQEYDV